MGCVKDVNNQTSRLFFNMVFQVFGLSLEI